MLHPSYSDLMKVVNSEVEPGEEKIVNSRYSIVMATAKRARQIIGGHEPMVKVKPGEKPLSIAVDELNQGKIKILGEDGQLEDDEDGLDFLGGVQTAVGDVATEGDEGGDVDEVVASKVSDARVREDLREGQVKEIYGDTR